MVPVAESALGDLAQPLVGRGAAYADLDGDGDLDVVVTQAGDRAVVFATTSARPPLAAREAARQRTTVPRDAIGAEVSLRARGGVQRRTVSPSRSYQSQVELPVTFGLGYYRSRRGDRRDLARRNEESRAGGRGRSRDRDRAALHRLRRVRPTAPAGPDFRGGGGRSTRSCETSSRRFSARARTRPL